MRLTLSAYSPFSLSAVVASHGWSQLAPFHYHPQRSELIRIERLENRHAVEIAMRAAPTGVRVEVRGAINGAQREEVARKVWWMLGLGQDLAPFYALARHDPHLAHVEVQAQGRMLRSPTLFEDTVKTMLSTSVPWVSAKHMNDALVTQLGTPLATDPSRCAFPTPVQVAAAELRVLREEIGLEQRVEFVLDLAQRVASGTLDLESLKEPHCSTSEVRKTLDSIRGLEPHAVSKLLILTGHYDCVPVDAWARERVAREWYGGAPVETAQVEAAFADWGSWKALAYWFWDWSNHNSVPDEEAD